MMFRQSIHHRHGRWQRFLKGINIFITRIYNCTVQGTGVIIKMLIDIPLERCEI